MTTARPKRIPRWLRNLGVGFLISIGSIVILLPAWLPDDPGMPIERGIIEILQVILLGLSFAIVVGATPHAGSHRPICRAMAFALAAAVLGEIEDLFSDLLGRSFRIEWIIGALILAILITFYRHRRHALRLLGLLTHNAATGFLAAALLILYVFNRVFGSTHFWRAALEEDFSPRVPIVCRAYLELLACYFILVGVVGFTVGFIQNRRHV